MYKNVININLFQVLNDMLTNNSLKNINNHYDSFLCLNNYYKQIICICFANKVSMIIKTFTHIQTTNE